MVKMPHCEVVIPGWECRLKPWHDGDHEMHRIEPKLWEKIYYRLFYCTRYGHIFVFESHGLIGDWIRCVRCWHLDEWIPGTHEPRGYND